MHFRGRKSESAASIETALPGQRRRPSDLPGELAGPLDRLEGAVEGPRDRRLEQALAQADPEVAAEHLHEMARGERVAARQELAEAHGLAGGRPGGLDRGERVGHLAERGRGRRIGCMAGPDEEILHREADVGEAVVGLAEGLRSDAGQLEHRGRRAGPTEPGRARVVLREGTAGEERGRDRQVARVQRAEIGGQQLRLLGGPGRRRDRGGGLAPASHGGGDGTLDRVLQRSWFPSDLVGSTVVLRRHSPANLAAFRRWYSDPEVARLTRYQDVPMRPDEIDRFFEVRALGPGSLAMAIHVRESGRLIGSCAFSQRRHDVVPRGAAAGGARNDVIERQVLREQLRAAVLTGEPVPRVDVETRELDRLPVAPEPPQRRTTAGIG